MTSDTLLTPSQLFGDDALSALPAREPARHVAQVVRSALTLNDDAAAYREMLWRLKTAEEQIRQTRSNTVEAGLLQRIVDAIPLNDEPLSHLYMPLVEYAAYLEREACFDDALKVLGLAARAHNHQLPSSQFAKLALDSARLNRQLACWDRAGLCYNGAEQIGTALNDPVLSLRGKLGRGAILRGQGQLRAAEMVARGVVDDARRLSSQWILSPALLDLSVVLSDQGRYAEGLAADREALQVASNDDDRTRALGNVGVSLADLGRYTECRRPLEATLASAPTMLVRLNTRLEFLKLEATLGNRMAFERHRRALENVRDRMNPSMIADFGYKLGVGYRRFGQQRWSLQVLREAYVVAAAHGLGHWRRRIGRELKVASAL